MGFHGVSASSCTSSCAVTTLCALKGVIFGRSGNGEGVVKGSWSEGGPSLLGDTITDDVAAVTCSRTS